MCDTGYTPRDLVADLRDLKARGVPEGEMLEEVSGLVKRLVMMKHNWLRPSMQVPSGDITQASIYQLHEEPDHSLAVFVVTWPPGEETRPHEHRTWAVVGGLDGWETQHLWKRLDDGSKSGHAELVRERSERIDSSTIVTLGSNAIHSVQNDSGALSVTLHIYGMHPDYTGRLGFDPERHTSSPYNPNAMAVR